VSEPFGQVSTEIPAQGEGGSPVTAISAGREVEQGARSMLLLAEGLFRLDVVPQNDMVQTVIRNLSPAARAELRFHPVGGESSVLGGGREVTVEATGRFGGEVVLVEEDGEERVVAKVLVGSVCRLDRGVTGFTAQATLS
jgi:hypothetical protein